MLWVLAALCAFFVKGLCGFANTLVFTSILSFSVSNARISPVELLLGYPTNAILVLRERKSIDWKICLPLSALVLLGSIPGAVMLKNVNTDAVRMAFGVVIIAVGLEMLLRGEAQEKQKSSRAALAVIGVLSGVLCGLFGVGALLGAYIGRTAKDSRAFRANICFVFFAENTLRIGLYASAGLLTADTLLQAAQLAPAMLLGLYLGMRAGRRMDERIAKKIVIWMLIISGAALIAKAL